MQGIAVDLMAIKYHTKKIEILRSHCESILKEIKCCQYADQQSAALIGFSRFRTVLKPFVSSWASLDSFESYLRQFTIAGDIEVMLERLDALLTENNVVSRLPPRNWCSPFGHATMEDSDSLVDILKQQGGEIWITAHSTVLESVVEYLPTLIKYHDSSSSTEATTAKILNVLGISL
ncbi:hypothetical protein BOTBODRAFT_57999 [Botryobasidium botryosum FD-172 SS1]|uniref:Uncharacterized protein n=1 Tax=Botryobasidium botryosum (strain FD-172 SS1) TaxID=930990 RepID=A0A067M4X8_BOTB1|nr:hypothetical protein BOTBODRAFT_57999 [Botryobasidium botryosum FD-172 SS1]